MEGPVIGVVGPCGSGKTTLVAGLRRRGFQVRHIAQEHSYVPDMWQRIAHPDILVYLQVSYPASQQRRRLNWTPAEYEQQIHRLRHARRNADLVIDTDPLTIEQVLQNVLDHIA